MKENMNERNNEQTIIKVLSIPEDLPELSDSDVKGAQSHHSLSWAHNFMMDRKSGQTHWLTDVGIHLQKVDDDVVRCIAVVSHPYCFANLNMLKLTFETANMKLEVEPYTLVIPYTPEEKNSSMESPGLEVA